MLPLTKKQAVVRLLDWQYMHGSHASAYLAGTQTSSGSVHACERRNNAWLGDSEQESHRLNELLAVEQPISSRSSPLDQLHDSLAINILSRQVL
jgi:hypothetical protein